MASPNPGDRRPTTLTEILSTIGSALFSELIIAVASYEVRLPWAVVLFAELRAVDAVKNSKLVFLLEMPGSNEARRELVENMESLTARGLFDFLDSPPSIRIARPRHYKWDFLDFE